MPGDSNDASSSIFGVAACESLASLYKSAMDKINDILALADGPRKILRDIQSMLDYPFEKANRMVNNILNGLKDIDGLLGDLLGLDLDLDLQSLKDILDGIKKLSSCPLISDIPCIKSISALVDQAVSGAISKGLLNTLLGDIVNQVKSAVQSRVTGVLNQYKGLIDNSIGDMISKYTDKLNVIKDPLKQLNDLKKCLDTVCKTYKAVGQFATGDVPDIMDQLKCKFDDAGNLVSTISEKATKKVVDASEAVKKNLTELQENAEAFYKKWMPNTG